MFFLTPPLKSYRDFAKRVDFAYWWNSMKKDLRLQPGHQTFRKTAIYDMIYKSRRGKISCTVRFKFLNWVKIVDYFSLTEILSKHKNSGASYKNTAYWGTLNLLTCVDSSTETNKFKYKSMQWIEEKIIYSKCYLSCAMCHMSPVTCHLTPTLHIFVSAESPRTFGDATARALVLDRV